MPEHSPEPPRLPCRHCTESADQHANGQCLFAATKYEPIEPGAMREWWCKKYSVVGWGVTYDHRNIEQVYFDLGRVWAYESKPGEPAGRWTYCGALRKIDTSMTPKDDLVLV